MIEFVRKRKKGIVNFILLGLAVILMISFGIESFHPGQSAQEAAIKINGDEITRFEFDQRLRSVERLYEQRLGGAFDQFRASLNLPQKIADQIVDRHLLSNFLDSLGLTASTQQVEERIAQLPYFNGKVDKQSFAAYLSASGMTEAGLENAVQKEIVEGELQNALSQLAGVTDAEMRVEYERANEQAKFIAAKFDSAALASSINPSDEELKKYYSDNVAKFIEPKKVGIEYVKLSPALFADKTAVVEEDVKQLYEERKDQMVLDEEYQLSKIALKLEGDEEPKDDEAESKLSPNDKKRQLAQKIIDRFKKGEEFAKIVPEGGELADLGWKKPGEVNDEVLAGIETLKLGEVSGLIEDGNEVAVYLLEGKKDKRTKSYEEVKNDLFKELQLADAPLYLETEADRYFEKLEAQTITLSQLASETGAEVQTLDNISERMKLLPPEVVKASLQEEKDRIARVSAGEDIYIFRVLDITPEAQLSFEQVEKSIREKVAASKAKEVAKERASELIAKLSTNPSIDSFKALAGEAAIIETELKKVTETTAEFLDSPDRVRHLFQLSTGSPIFKDPILSGGSAYVVMLTEKQPADMGNFAKERPTLLMKRSRESGERILDAIVAELKRESEIVVNPEILQSSDEDRSAG